MLWGNHVYEENLGQQNWDPNVLSPFLSIFLITVTSSFRLFRSSLPTFSLLVFSTYKTTSTFGLDTFEVLVLAATHQRERC